MISEMMMMVLCCVGVSECYCYVQLGCLGSGECQWDWAVADDVCISMMKNTRGLDSLLIIASLYISSLQLTVRCTE